MDSWNDERLDEMSRRMDEGFKEIREKMVTREEMKELIVMINARFERVERETKEGFEHVNQRFDRLYYAMVTALFGLVVSVVLAMTFS